MTFSLSSTHLLVTAAVLVIPAGLRLLRQRVTRMTSPSNSSRTSYVWFGKGPPFPSVDFPAMEGMWGSLRSPGEQRQTHLLLCLSQVLNWWSRTAYLVVELLDAGHIAREAGCRELVLVPRWTDALAAPSSMVLG
jgi:hypothetical protein